MLHDSSQCEHCTIDLGTPHGKRESTTREESISSEAATREGLAKKGWVLGMSCCRHTGAARGEC